MIEEEKSKADAALMEALPAVEAATEALSNIKREDLHELKAFNNPPIHVKIVCQMCSILRPTGEKFDDSWGDSKKMLGNPKLLDLLKEYPKDDITEKMYNRCKKTLKENKKHDMAVENMATKSQAGKGLLVWVYAILKYYEIAQNVEPLKDKVKEMQKAQVKTEAELYQLNELIKKLDIDLSELRLAYQDAKKELSKLQTQATQMERRLCAASSLINGLKDERIRWGQDMEELKKYKSTLTGNFLLVSGFLSFMGPFTAEYRHKLLHEELMSDLSKRDIFFLGEFQVETILSSKAELQRWNADGLPKDEYSMQNGILTRLGHRFPLCIDPQQQATSWIKHTFENSQLTIKTLQDGDFLKHLELAIQFGNPFLIEDVGEEIDPILDSILEKNISSKDGLNTVLLGDKSVEWDSNFQLFFCTKLSNPSFSPEIMGKVTIVNYSVTKEGLTDQLLNIVVSHEKPVRTHQMLVPSCN